ncbi:MAG: glycosyltransferase family 2 protein [Patescibacteria group bacterium]|nr:glycosyltransferase family 2 protein [Patescibacteria group bacterium]
MFSIIIVNFNTRELLKNCLTSIFKSCGRKNFEIIVIDNNSGDGSLEMLEENFGRQIIIIANKENIGFGAANNLGAKTARGEYLFFLNSDTIIRNDILAPAEKIFSSSKNIGILAPQLILLSGDKQPEAYGRFPNLANLFIRKFRKIFAKENKILPVDWVSGAALFIRKNVFQKISGFDENFFMYFEDIDLCKRVRDINYEVAVLPSISVVHLGGKSLKDNKTRKKYYYFSQDYFYKKHYGKSKLFLLKIIRWPYKLIVLAK